LIEPMDLDLLLPYLLYAETHYRFKYFFSYLRKREPELVFDAPHRVDPGCPIPLLLLVKDADKFPCEIPRIEAGILKEGEEQFRIAIFEGSLDFREPMSWKLFDLDPRGLRGWIEVDVQFTIRCGPRTRCFRNDNYRTSSRRPLRVYLSDDSLPRLPDVCYGDVHTHSSYTDDQVEFGAPLAPAMNLARTMGLSFFCTTDHSYDLDDSIQTYLRNDPTLPKWTAFQREVDDLNSTVRDVVIVRGEEVSCRNSRGRNVHLLLLGNRTFVPGSGDSAERWFRTKSEYSISGVLESLETGTISIAAHPREEVPFLQRMLIGRGRWEYDDLHQPRLRGLQFPNGTLHDGFFEGKAFWIRSLLAGGKLIIVGGNDSHGNFNRFRQIGIPFVKIVERSTQLFGQIRTGVLLEDQISESSILSALAAGRCFVTDGPLCIMTVEDEGGKKMGMGETTTGTRLRCRLQVLSTPEYGTVDRLILRQGVLQSDEEEILQEIVGSKQYRLDTIVPVCATTACYLRAEVSTSGGSTKSSEGHFAITNPIWIHPSP